MQENAPSLKMEVRLPTEEERALKKAQIHRGGLIARKQTAYALAEIWQDGESWALTLDGGSQVNTTDEQAYHTYLVRPALISHGDTRHVIIVGGADMGVLREVIESPQVLNVTMVEIDGELVDMCKEHLVEVHNNSYKDPRVRLIISDGLGFLREASADSADIVIVDGTDYRLKYDDSRTYGNSLFSAAFYKEVFRVLRPKGMLVSYASNLDVTGEIRQAGFNHIVPYEILLSSLDEGGARYYLAMKGGRHREAMVKFVIRDLHKYDMGQKLTATQLKEIGRAPPADKLPKPDHVEL
mmetsp:Transcript_59656/g.109254  ORF Transcript_59656/g.109254 Transcript_59656/m.109254 type:complete len:297 (-) Transcript_59656:32-922(-)